jgi:hypothetical protein
MLGAENLADAFMVFLLIVAVLCQMDPSFWPPEYSS